MRLSKRTKKIDDVATQNLDILKIILDLQKEIFELKSQQQLIQKNLNLLSSTLAEKAVVQKFLVDQVANTAELLMEIDKVLHPNSYIKHDIMNEPYN